MVQRAFVAIVGAVAFCGAAGATVHTFNFPLDGLQEVPPVATPAFGFGMVTYDSDTNMLSWSISYQDLIGTITDAHFHGPADYGVNAGVRVGIGPGPSPLVGSTMISEAFASELLDGLWYVNIHSTFRPGGEIRGQVVPAPGALALFGLSGLLAARRRRS